MASKFNIDATHGSKADRDGSDREDAASGAVRGAASGAKPAAASAAVSPPAASGATRIVVKLKEIKFSTYPGWPKEAVFGVSKEKTKRGRRRDASLVENDSHGVFGDVVVQSGDSHGVFGEDVPIETPRAVRAVPAAPTMQAFFLAGLLDDELSAMGALRLSAACRSAREALARKRAREECGP